MRSLLGSTAILAMCSLLDPARADDTQVFLTVIASDADAAPGVTGGLDLPFFVNGTDAPLVDDNGKVYFFSESTFEDLPSPNFSGIWTGSGGALTAIAVENQVPAGFDTSGPECVGIGPTCGELFNLNNRFYVSPDGEAIFRSSQDIATSGLGIFARSDGLNPIVIFTGDDDPDFDDGRLSRVTRSGIYIAGDFVGDAPFGSGAGTNLVTGELQNFVDPLINAAAPGAGGLVTIDAINGVSSPNELAALYGFNESADILYQTDLSDGGGALYLNPASTDGDDTLILLAGQAAAGLANGKFIDINTAQLNNNGQGVVVAFWNELAQGSTGNARQGIWRFDASGALELVVSDREDLDDPAYSVAGFGAQQVSFDRAGPTTFRNVTIAPNGDIYFLTIANNVDADTGAPLADEVSGLWRAPAAGGPLEVIFQERDDDDEGTLLLGDERVSFSGFGNSGFGFDVEGNMIIDLNARAPDGTVTGGLYVLTMDGELLLIAEKGQEIEVSPGVFMEIDNLSFNSADFVGGTVASFRNNNLAFNVEFTNNSVAILQATLQGEVVIVTDFVWSGACGNADWHAGCTPSSWNDPDNNAAELAPGDENGTQSVAINDADVVISDRAVDIDALTATGSLTVERTLTLRSASTIEDLVLSGTIIADDDLELSGTQNLWTGGTLSGAGSITLGIGATLTVTPADTAVDLETTLMVNGTALQTGGTLNLVGADALLDVSGGGTYEIQAGNIADTTDGTHIQNRGTFLKTGDEIATIDAGFENDLIGDVRVQAGTLRFIDTSTWAGDLRVLEDGVAEISGTTANFGSDKGNFIAAGAGILRLSGATVHLTTGTQTLVDFSSAPGAPTPASLSVVDGTTFTGSGTLRNEGQLNLVGDGISFAEGVMVENGGIFTKTGAGATTFASRFANDGAAGASPGGIVQVQEGSLAFSNTSTWGGQLEVNAGAVTEFGDTVTIFGTPGGAGFEVLGEGNLRLHGGDVLLSPGTQTRFNLTGDSGFVELLDGVTIGGGGTILNGGHLRVTNAALEAGLTNEGTLTLTDGAHFFLNEDIGTFTNEGTIAVTGPGQAIIDGPLEDALISTMVLQNTGDIRVHSGSLLVRFATLDLGADSTLTAANNTEATLQSSRIDVTGNTSFEGMGAVNVGGSATDLDSLLTVGAGATLTNAVDGGLLADNALANGLRVRSGSTIAGDGTLRNVSGMTFSSGEISVAQFINEAAGQFVIGPSAEGTRFLNTVLQNQANVTQTADLLLGSDDGIENNGTYRLVGAVRLAPEDPTAIFTASFNNNDQLTKIGPDTATIDIIFENADDIAVAGGELLLSGGATFDGGESVVTLSNSGILTLRSDDPADDYIFENGTTQVVGTIGDGMFAIADDVQLRGANALSISASAQWIGGDISLTDTDTKVRQLEVGGDRGIGELTIAGDTGRIVGENVLYVAANGTVRQQSDITFVGGATAQVDGVYELSGSIATETILLPGEDAPNTVLINETGTLRVPAMQMAEIAGPVPVRGTVEVETGGSLRVDLSEINQFSQPTDGGFIVRQAAIRGNWVLEENANIRDQSEGAGAVELDGLAAGARVTLNEGSSFYNLPTVEGNFTLLESAVLTLNNTTLTIGGAFENRGLLLGTNSVINVAESYISSFESIFGGDEITVNTNLRAEGRVVPGTSPGVITINGDYTQAGTGVLEIELGGTQAATAYDQLIVNGNAVFEEGAQIAVTLIDPDLSDGDPTVFVPETGDIFNVLLADSIDLTGQSLENIVNFSGLPTGLMFDVGLVSLGDATALQLSAIFGSSLIEVPDLTAAQTTLAAALDTVSASGMSDQLSSLALSIDGLATAQEQRAALDQVTHSFITGFVDLARTAARTSQDHITNRLDSVIWHEMVIDKELQQSSMATAGAQGQRPVNTIGTDISGADHVTNYASLWLGGIAAGEATVMDQNGFRVYLSASYDRGNFGASDNQTGFDYDGPSGTIGVEYASSDSSWLIGLAGTFSSFDGDADFGRGTIEVDSKTVSGYGFIKAGPAVFDGVFSYGQMDQNTLRRVALPGEAFAAAAQTDADFLALTARISAPFESGRMRFGPVVAVTYTDIDVDGFAEEGANEAGLLAANQSAQYGAAEVGGRVILRHESGNWIIEPRLTAALHHAFVSDAPNVDARFIGAPDNPFVIPTEAIDDTSLSLDAGITFYAKGRFSFSADYNAFLLNGDTSQHSISARVAARF